jgi:archaeal preflagellin peptidase FlaK
MIFITTVIISVIGVLIATYTDLKERIVPNQLNFALALIGLMIYGIQSFLVESPLPFLYSFWGMIFGFLFGWVLWKGGVFAGGDVKLFTALGALNPFTPALLKIDPFVTSQFNVFPITLFIYSTFAFLPYGIAIMFYKLSKNKGFQKKLWNDLKIRIKQATHFAIFSAGTYTLLEVFEINSIVILPIMLAWILMKEYKVFATIIIFIAAIIAMPYFALHSLGYSLLIVVGGYTLIKMMFSMRPLLSKEIDVKDLEEGMIPSKTLVKKGKKIVELEGISLGQMIKYAKKQKLNELLNPGEEIISSRKARGVTVEELEEVKKLAKAGKISKTIFVKDTLPFVPTILLGYILCLALGDFWLILIGGLI